MTPLPVNNTARTVVRYRSGQNTHSLMVRHTDAATAAQVGTALDGFLTQISPNIYEMQILDASRYGSGDDVSTPSVIGIEGDIYGATNPSIKEEAAYMDFVGRTSGGRRVRVTVFGPTDLGGNYRISVGEFASIAPAVAALTADPDVFLAVDGLQPAWKPYANTGYNSYWEREQRG